MAQNTTEAMQEFLDSLSQIPGSIIYRDRIAWKALPPGPAGWVLTWNETDGIHWADPATL